MKLSTISEKIYNKKIVWTIIFIGLILSVFVANFVVHIVYESIMFLLDFSKDFDKATFNVSWKEFFNFKTNLWQGYIAFYIFIILLIGKIIYSLTMNYSDLNEEQHGSRRFATKQELKKQYHIIPSKDEEYEGNGGVIVGGLHEKGRKYRLLLDDSKVHNIIIGITRSGKGETFVVPMLDVLSRAKKRPSIVVNDPKGELAGASYETLKKRGYDVKILNLMEQSMSIGFNPLQLVIDMWKKGDESKAQQYANSIAHSFYHNPTAKEPFFDNSAKSLVTAIILALTEDAINKGREHQVNLYSVATFLSEKGSEEDDEGNNMLDEFFKKRPMGNPAKNAYATSKFSDGKTRSSIFSVAMEKLQIFILEPNARMTSHNTLDLLNVGFGDKPIALFMVIPDYDTSNHALASIFVSQLYRINAEVATKEGQKMKRHIHFMLDEVGNMPPIDGLGGMVTVGAGRGFRYHLVLQTYTQLKQKYGEDEAEVIKDNCSNHIYILSQGKGTVEEFSSLLGNKTITDVSRTGQIISSDKSHNESTTSRELLKPDELLQLREGESVVLRGNKRQDVKRNKIISYPIYNSLESGTYQKFRYEYLADDFDTDISVLGLPVHSKVYDEINLQDSIYRTEISAKDGYTPIKHVFNEKEVSALKENLMMLSKKHYASFGDWSLIHVFSHIIYDLRVEKEYYDTFINVLKPLLELDEGFIEEWNKIYLNVIEKKGAV